MKFEEIKTQIEEYQAHDLRLFSSSSFQTHSLVLLHIISRIDKEIPIYFINTGFLFPETIQFRDEIGELFDLNIININPETPKSSQKNSVEKFLFTENPTRCCHVNKVVPLDSVLTKYDVWINGVRADQSAVRKQMKPEQKAPHNTLRFHPMLDWSKQDIFKYLKEHNIPHHPLDKEGYSSIGCEPCTRKMILGDERASRWFGMNKTECGLNTDLVK
ncbi:phosphoadenylylsulfate reductase (thioredoxin) [Balneicella halophila]|uniref:Adenosine 5'-phosphosulfate reductase n=1 Tax=Balneicella halophila TaxID=1537566 RepID=A0A7L4UN02_BALHA|nr:phosphoadenylyl-sulfate reductase [Balneicella halophila]PVX49855.1 phosphoadenylylsulfate reductase (thioredoxin) [Balneicella halophila]